MHLLKVEILSYWMSGTGAGGGFAHDSAQILDSQGLPFLPGKHLKGLLRDAVHRAAIWSKAADPTDALFGAEGNAHGLIEIRDARLPTALAECFTTQSKNNALFRTLAATAIEDGVAKQRSLRSLRVALPMTLYASVEESPDAAGRTSGDVNLSTIFQGWPDLVNAALPLVRAVGSGRMHGLGRAVLTLEKQK